MNELCDVNRISLSKTLQLDHYVFSLSIMLSMKLVLWYMEGTVSEKWHTTAMILINFCLIMIYDLINIKKDLANIMRIMIIIIKP